MLNCTCRTHRPYYRNKRPVDHQLKDYISAREKKIQDELKQKQDELKQKEKQIADLLKRGMLLYLLFVYIYL